MHRSSASSSGRVEDNHQLPAQPGHVGEVDDLLDGGDQTLVGLFLARAPDPALALLDDVVIDSGLHDRLEQW
ncbi:hypothetical protein AB0D83_13935 [Streptomyces decoyicus]|uniref:hypothetical protein n=1 Tax=Streptomyces decoyicus TaxID=249567 RepID=UPI00340AA8BD